MAFIINESDMHMHDYNDFVNYPIFGVAAESFHDK